MTNNKATSALMLVLMTIPLLAQRQMEDLGRGVVAVRTGNSSVYVGWRLLGTDPDDTKFNLYRVTSGVTNLVAGNVTSSCNFLDNGALLALTHSWFVQPMLNGVTQANSMAFTMPANTPTQQYLNITLQKPADGNNPSGPFTYNANDCSAADLDGDGEYEIILKWDPSNSKDNAHSGFTGDVFLDAYKLDSTLMWRINLGPNIRAGAHYTQFMVYDLDGDGRAELACKTAPGTRDGLGHYVDGNASYTVYTNSSGYILSGPEYFTIFDGLTGANLVTTNYNVPRGSVSSWGDSYGNRVDRFLAGIAYLDGVRPSVLMCRGYYTRTAVAAWDWRNGQLTQRWVFDTGHSGGPWTDYKGQGNHQLSVADVDADGRDEIIYGACTINDDGTGLYTMGLHHGDALHVSDLDPARLGYERWGIHETASTPGSALTDAGTGEVIWLTGNADVGRGVAADLNASFPGAEVWGGTSGLRSVKNESAGGSPSSSNFAVWWDADLIRELEDGNQITKYGGATLLTATNATSNNGTKSTPCLSADLFGDWREEVIWRTTDNLNLRIYTTTFLATNRIPTLMHDPQYRVAIAWQNVAYNQPPHPGFYLGAQMLPAPRFPVSSAALAWRGGNGGNSWTSANNWFANGVWTNDAIATYAAGNSVLFDLRASNKTSITISGTVTPGDVTVYSPANFTFSGSGSISGAAKLFKSGPGKLTINTTNNFTGGTFVSGGQLIVNGALNGSPVVVEARGEPWGRARIGGSGWLGQGLTVQRDCGVIVGPATNAAGVLTITNGLTELGGVLNEFDLSNLPGGNNDRIDVIGNLTLSGTNVIRVTQLNGSLNAGVYPLITYSGTLSGGLGNLTLTGDFIQPVALTNPPGMIALAASIPPPPVNAPSGLAAAPVGAFQISLGWNDNSSNENGFVLQRSVGSPASFSPVADLPADSIDYQDMGLAPNTTYYYRITATNLAGASAFSNTNSATTTPLPSELVWRGDGISNVWDIGGDLNWFDGANYVVYSDTSDVVFDNSGTNTPNVLLAEPLAPGSITFAGTKSYTFGTTTNGEFTGAMDITVTGSGTQTINTANSFTGGVNLNSGVLSLGSTSAAGTGSIRFNGGTLRMVVGSQQYYANALVINSNSTIQSQGGNNNVVSGVWSGSASATLNIAISSSGYFTLGGNMTGFPGTVSAGNSGGNLRFYGSTGSASTTYDVGTGTCLLNNRNGVTVTLGALTGGAGTFLSGAGAVNSPSTYIIGGKNLSTVFAGTVQDANSSRIVNLQKTGTGVLTLTGNNTYTGTTTVDGGTLLIDGNHSAATGTVTVGASGTLGGNGIIGSDTTVNGTLAPGASLGTLTFNGNLTFNASGKAQLEITANPVASDFATLTGNLSLNGTLQVLNAGIEMPQAGDVYQLFNAGSISGAFASYDLPTLDTGLAWDTSQLATNGTLSVVVTTPPSFTAIIPQGATMQLIGDGGTPGRDYYVLSSTNLTLPANLWVPLLTNQFDGSGQFDFLMPLGGNDRQRYYRLTVP